MRIKRSEPGLIVSSAAHVALLAATLVAFSNTRKFEDAQEAVPVEMITDQAFNQIAKGERAAREARPVQRAEKIAETPELKPTPPLAEARKDTPLPPPPFRRMPDPGEAEEKPPEPVRQAALPPPRPSESEKPAPPEPPQRPQPPKPEPAKAEPKPAPQPRPQPEKEARAEPEDEKAEPAAPPKPVARPRDVTREPVKETPKPAPKPVEKAQEKPQDKPVAAAPEKPRLKTDEVAALLAKTKPESKPTERPKSGEESDQKTKFDANAISRMLDKDKPQATASAGRETVRTASLGAPNATAQKMSPNMMAALDSLMMEQYKACWRYFGAATGHKYVPAVRVRFRPDGALAGEPALINPTSDPALTSLAESAMRAVRTCNPLRIPAQFAPYYDQWKSRAIAFDPQEMI